MQRQPGKAGEAAEISGLHRREVLMDLDATHNIFKNKYPKAKEEMEEKLQVCCTCNKLHVHACTCTCKRPFNNSVADSSNMVVHCINLEAFLGVSNEASTSSTVYLLSVINTFVGCCLASNRSFHS